MEHIYLLCRSSQSGEGLQGGKVGTVGPEGGSCGKHCGFDESLTIQLSAITSQVEARVPLRNLQSSAVLLVHVPNLTKKQRSTHTS